LNISSTRSIFCENLISLTYCFSMSTHFGTLLRWCTLRWWCWF